MKPDWTRLLDQESLAAVLPAEYAHFARPIRDGLSVFLGGLPVEEQQELLRIQATQPPATTMSRRLGLLARGSPVLQKLGQVLARDQRLPLGLRLQLQELESLPPLVSLETIKRVLAEELGPLEACGVTLMPPAIAEASVAVVIPFLADQAEGVFKVLKPGIEAKLYRDLGLLEQVGSHLDEQCEELGIPHLDYEQAFERVKEKLRDEVDLVNEQRHLAEARVFFAAEPGVQIPRLMPQCSPRVTAMERIHGEQITSHGRTAGREKRRIARQLAAALIARPIFARQDPAMFHADPHAGNLMLTADGRLAILDWSLVGHLATEERGAIVQVLLSAIMLDATRITAVLTTLADVPRIDGDALSGVVHAWLRRIRHGQFPGLSWLTGMLDDATQNAGLRVSADLMLFRKSLLTLEGVVAEVGEQSGQLDDVLIGEFLRHFAREWPKRWLSDPRSREFATRLSNFDLTKTMFRAPAAATRFWAGHALDLLQGCAGQERS